MRPFNIYIYTYTYYTYIYTHIYIIIIIIIIVIIIIVVLIATIISSLICFERETWKPRQLAPLNSSGSRLLSKRGSSGFGV